MKEKICKHCGNAYPHGNAFHKLCFTCNKLRLSGQLGEVVEHENEGASRKVALKMRPKVGVMVCHATGSKHAIVNPHNVKGEKELFAIIWYERPHICKHCGVSLGNEMKAHYFSHIYPKSIRPWLRLDPDNIELLCIECHTSHDFGERKHKLS